MRAALALISAASMLGACTPFMPGPAPIAVAPAVERSYVTHIGRPYLGRVKPAAALPAPAPAPPIPIEVEPAIPRLLSIRPDMAFTVVFSGDERVEGVIVGNLDVFAAQTLGNHKTVAVTASRAAARGSLSIVTDRGAHFFELASVSAYDGMAPELGLVIGAGEASAASGRNAAQGNPSIETLNWAYSYDGSEALRPLRVFDDGAMTWFRFPAHIPVPAIFEEAPDGSEGVVNHHRRGDYFVVERLGRAFVLRDGDHSVRIVNKNYPADSYGPEAPPREERAALARIIFGQGPGR